MLKPLARLGLKAYFPSLADAEIQEFVRLSSEQVCFSEPSVPLGRHR